MQIYTFCDTNKNKKPPRMNETAKLAQTRRPLRAHGLTDLQSFGYYFFSKNSFSLPSSTNCSTNT